VKKDKNWLKEELSKQIDILHTTISSGNYVSLVKRAEIMNLIDQLDEPKITEEQALNKLAESYSYSRDGINAILQAQLARYSPVSTVKFVQPSGTKLPAIPQWVVYIKNEYELSMYYDCFNGSILPNGKFDSSYVPKHNAYKFTDKSKAEAVALLINGAVEEVTE